MEILTQWMTLVSNRLLPVVLLILTLMSCMVLIYLGGFFREFMERKGARRKLEKALHAAQWAPHEVKDILKSIRTGLGRRFFLVQNKDRDGILNTLDSEVASCLAVLSLLTRLGPMGGLIATLLPLGPALQALANNQLGDLASQLNIAFTATVIGLCVSCLAYLMGLVRRTWYAKDLDDIESILHLTQGSPVHES